METGVSLVIDGMTGVGKSSLLEILVEELGLIPFQEIFRDENDLLGKYHKEGARWCFPMQVSFLNNRFQQYKEACRLNNAAMDRSIFSDPIFAGLYQKTGDMQPEEYYVYNSLFRSLVETLNPPKLVIYLEVSIDEALRRIKGRGREDEIQMPETYWRNLHQVYTDYYQNYRLAPLLKINVSTLDFVNNPLHRKQLVGQIKSWYRDELKEAR